MCHCMGLRTTFYIVMCNINMTTFHIPASVSPQMNETYHSSASQEKSADFVPENRDVFISAERIGHQKSRPILVWMENWRTKSAAMIIRLTSAVVGVCCIAGLHQLSNSSTEVREHVVVF